MPIATPDNPIAGSASVPITLRLYAMLVTTAISRNALTKAP
jgi:hypothetical protein